ncbi:MAG: hypothetical protein ABSF32_02395 [Ignavibacteria bacterium]|jgi:hypothetical protein
MKKIPKYIFIILPLVLLGLLTGIWAGCIRIGWNFPLSSFAGEHGALMVGSFLGTLICLERAFTFPKKIALMLPLFNSLSFIFIIAKYPVIAYWVLFIGSMGLVVLYFFLYLKFSELYVLLMMMGAMCWVIGNGLLLQTSFYPQAVTWWIGFLFLTITGERLELSRYLNIGKSTKSIFVILIALFIIGITIPFHEFGGYVTAVSLIGSSLWLFIYDMPRRNLKNTGVHKYSGIVLLTGFFWLFICGLLMAYGSYEMLLYDAVLHTFFIGFVFSMIFAHAPIILPGILGIPVKPFHGLLYVWFILLQLSLLMRLSVLLTNDVFIKQLSGMISGIVIIGFIVNMEILVAKGKMESLSRS